MIKEHPLQAFLAGGDHRKVALMLGTALAIIGGVLGLALAVIGPIYTGILLIALAAAIWVMAGLENALWSMIAVVLLLPFATLPFKVVITPSFLDLAMGAVYFLYLMQWMTGERRRLATTPIHAFIILFMLLAVFSFIAGLRHAGLTPNGIRKFAEMLLSMGTSLILVDILRTPEQIRRFVLVIILAGAATATLGIVLWLLPDLSAERILMALSRIGYPNSGVIQYIEQNPELSERAISTSVNPNSFGGTLVVVAALAAPQIVTHYPITGKRWHTIPILLALVVCLLLTFSRGAMVAFGAALVFISVLRYRRALLVLMVIALLLLVLPWTQAYVQRFIEGIQGQDLAMKMRFGEIKDALILIGRYPLLGVGFSGVPDIDIYLSVSSMYLLMTANMGLLGLAVFVILIISLFVYAWQARPHLEAFLGLPAIWLGLMAGLVGALVTGLGDHYFFNPEFHHVATLLWVIIGLLLATTRLALDEKERQRRAAAHV
ncbi:MAG: O-antigen ligase family protein [Anaerolineae bacterium]|nr:O-antigen ligase family protein [Anaerolineae bacterium]